MNRTKSSLSLIFLLLISLSVMAGKTKYLTVEINYGDQKPAETIQVECTRNMTALEALLRAAEVKTQPVANFVFVVSINGVEGIRGDKGWYYTVNGNAPKLAIQQPVSAGDVIRWRYVKDECSPTVDGGKKRRSVFSHSTR